MKIILISPWRNVWVNYMKTYFESKGHTLDYSDKLEFSKVKDYDVLISGWADEGVKLLSKYPKLCSAYYCWVRSYEFWHNNMNSIDFSKFDKVFFVNKYIKDSLNLSQGEMMPNAIDLEKIKFKIRQPGKEVLFLADINFKKGIPLLIQLARRLPDYNFNIYGNITDKRNYLYLRYCNLPNLFVRGYANEINDVFDKSNYILLTSPVEGNPNCIIEGMAAGLKPVIHRFVGSEGQFPEFCYWDTIDEAADIIKSKIYISSNYRKWIEEKYDMWEVYKRLEAVVSKEALCNH